MKKLVVYFDNACKVVFDPERVMFFRPEWLKVVEEQAAFSNIAVKNTDCFPVNLNHVCYTRLVETEDD